MTSFHFFIVRKLIIYVPVRSLFQAWQDMTSKPKLYTSVISHTNQLRDKNYTQVTKMTLKKFHCTLKKGVNTF